MAVSDFLMCNKFLRKHDIYSSEHTERYFSYKSCTFESTGNSSFGPVMHSSFTPLAVVPTQLGRTYSYIASAETNG